MKCKDCRFWELNEELYEEIDLPKDEEDWEGFCHRYPPRWDTRDYKSYSLETNTYDWCGEFKPKKINNLLKGDTE